MEHRRSRLAGLTIALALVELTTDTAGAQATAQAGASATTVVALKVDPAVKTDSA